MLFSGNGFHGKEWWAKSDGAQMQLGTALQPRLGRADHANFDESLDSVRDVEPRLAAVGQQVARAWPPAPAAPDRPRPADGLPADVAEHMRRLCDVLVLGRRLDAIREGPRAALDDTMLLYGSSMMTGNHDNDQLAHVVLGGGGGRCRGGRCLDLRAQPQRQMCRLLPSTMATMGVALDRFGDATEPLAEFCAAGARPRRPRRPPRLTAALRSARGKTSAPRCRWRRAAGCLAASGRCRGS